jgi:hypothetical protein
VRSQTELGTEENLTGEFNASRSGTRTDFRREFSWGTHGAQFREVSARPRFGLCRASNKLKPAIGGSAPSVVQAAEPPTAESSTAIVSRLKPDRDRQDRGPEDADPRDADPQRQEKRAALHYGRRHLKDHRNLGDRRPAEGQGDFRRPRRESKAAVPEPETRSRECQPVWRAETPREDASNRAVLRRKHCTVPKTSACKGCSSNSADDQTGTRSHSGADIPRMLTSACNSNFGSCKSHDAPRLRNIAGASAHHREPSHWRPRPAARPSWLPKPSIFCNP